MARIHVEGWAPEYGSPLQTDESLADEDRVDENVEVSGPWSPVPGTDDGVESVAFVDGVRRVDAMLTLEDEDGPPVAGICGTYAVGSVLWDRTIPASEITHAVVDRVSVRVRKLPTYVRVTIETQIGFFVFQKSNMLATVNLVACRTIDVVVEVHVALEHILLV